MLGVRLFFWRILWKVKTFFIKKGVQLNAFLPNFNLEDLDGKRWSLYQFFPHSHVLLWMTNLCVSCEEKIDFLEKLRRKHAPRLQILAVSVLGKDRETPQRMIQKYSFEFPLLLDPEDWVGQSLGLIHPQDSCPLFNFLLIHRLGKVLARGHLSAMTDAKTEALIQSVIH